jgi:hypothetical protein
MRYVKSSKPAAGKVEGLGDVSTEFEYPQFDTVAELVSSAGDDPKFLGWANSKVRAAAKQAAVNEINGSDKALGLEKVQSNARSAAHDWSIANARQRGTGVTAKAQVFDDIMARVRRGEQVSQDELATLAAQFGA